MRISDWSSDVCSSDLRTADGDQLVIGVLRQAEILRGLCALGVHVVGVLTEDGIHAADRLLKVRRGADDVADEHDDAVDGDQIGRASCRERVCQYVDITVVAVSLQKQKDINYRA